MAKHNDTGTWGEQIVTDYLTAKGYAIRERQWRLNHLEIDIIATKDDEIAFVEVKTRSNADTDPLEAINRRKMAHMGAAATAYMQQFDIPLKPRFDVAAITGTPSDYHLRYIADAFFPPLRTY